MATTKTTGRGDLFLVIAAIEIVWERSNLSGVRHREGKGRGGIWGARPSSLGCGM